MSDLRTTLLASAALVLAFSGQAWAHAHLKSAVPPQNGSVASPPVEIDLTFTEELNLKFTGVKVTGPGKAAVQTGTASLKAGDEATLIVPVSGTLATGSYTVDWHALSADGHKTKGTYKFAVKP